MFREPLYLLLALPLLALALAALAWASRRRKALAAALGEASTLRRLLPPQALRRRRWQAALRLCAMALLLLALAGPQWGVELVETTSSAQNVVVAVDVSLSMLSQDVKPDRLSRAKDELSLLIDGLKGARIGVIAFAGEPVAACPLTTDADAAKQLLQALDPNSAPVPGTGIGKAIRRAVGMLSPYSGEKTIVLLSDGEDHHTDPLGAAKEAAAAGVRIDTIGIGSPEGQPIPLRDASGALIGYKKDKSGATVISKLGEKDLAAIAQETGGRYYRSTPGASEALEIAQAATQAGSEGKSRGTTRRFKNHFMAPLAMAFLLLLAEWLIPETSGAPTLTALCLLALWPTGARAATAESHLRQGNKLYDAQKYQPALEQYGQAAAKSPRDARPIFNAGDALYRLERYDKAAEAFKSVAKGDSSAAARAGAYYNLGDSYFQQQDYASAVAAYRRALSLNPDDPDSRRNLAVALRFQRHPPPKRKKSGKNGNRQRQPQKPQPKDRSSNGGSKPPPPKPQPRDQMSKEDAERIMQAVSEREKAPRPARAARRKSETEEDW